MYSRFFITSAKTLYILDTKYNMHQFQGLEHEYLLGTHLPAHHTISVQGSDIPEALESVISSLIILALTVIIHQRQFFFSQNPPAFLSSLNKSLK